MMFTNLYIFLFSIISVQCILDLKYDKIAYTEDGRQCLNNCNDGYCVVDDSLKLYPCQNTDQDAPVHWTIHNKMCLSRCIEDDDSTGKCYIDQKLNWDYCEAKTTVEWVRDVPYTISNGPCKDACRLRCTRYGDCRKACNHYWKGWDYCQSEWTYNYIQARTIKGELCRGSCDQHLGRDYTWCAYGMRNEEACAFPGLPREKNWSGEVEALLSVKKPICIKMSGKVQINNCIKKEEDQILLHKFVQDIENSHRHSTVYLHDNVSPIYSYTHLKGSLQVPKIVRATIRPRHLFSIDLEKKYIPQHVQDNLNRMGKEINDKVGYFIDYYMSGSNENYNLFNLKPTSNTYDQDKKIIQFLKDNEHQLDTKAELLVVALYRDGETNPTGLARHVKLYHSHSLIEEYYEYLPNDGSDITSENTFSIPDQKSLLPPVHHPRGNGDECFIYYSGDLNTFTEEPNFDSFTKMPEFDSDEDNVISK